MVQIKFVIPLLQHWGQYVISTLPVPQLIFGLWSFSQLYPKIKSCFLRPKMVSSILSKWVPYYRRMSTTSEISLALFGEPPTLKTGMGHKIVQVLSLLEWTKPWSMKLPIALLSRRAFTEWNLLVSMVFSSTASCKEVLCTSKALVESWMGSFLFYFGLWEKRLHLEVEGEGISIGSPSSVLVSILSTVNLFTSSWGVLVTSHSLQNPCLLRPPGLSLLVCYILLRGPP